VFIIEIEGFDAIISTLTLAKNLYDIDRFDIVKEQFFDILSYESYLENIVGAITSIFSGYYNDYDDDDDDDAEVMIFTDEYIGRYFEMAWEYGRSNNVRHEDNPYVTEAESQVRRWLTFCLSMGFKLLGYTKTKKAARQSKLIVYLSVCDCDCHTKLAYGLIQLYQFFREKCIEFDKRTTALTALTTAPIVNINRKEAMAA
jgi:hypothetical protein